MGLMVLDEPPVAGRLTEGGKASALIGFPLSRRHLVVDAVTAVFPSACWSFASCVSRCGRRLWAARLLKACQG